MIPSGTPTPVGGGPTGNPSLLRTNSMIGQSGSIPTQPSFPSLVSPRTQFSNTTNTNMSLLGNMSNAQSLLNNSFGGGVPGNISGLTASHMNTQQRGGSIGTMDMVSSVNPDPLSFTSSSGQVQGQQQFANLATNHMGSDHSQGQQVDTPQNYQQQFSVPHNQQQQLRGGLGHAASVKVEAQMGTTDQIGPQQQLTSLGSQQQLASLGSQQQLASLGTQQQLASLGSQQQLASLGSQQQLASLRTLSTVKLEPQQVQCIRNLSSVKLEPLQHSDSSLFLQQQQQQQQQQQLLQLSRQSSQAAAQMNLLQQQRILHMQQQQQLLKTLPHQRVQQQQQQQQQQQLQQGMALRPQVKTAAYEPGTCARRLTQYMYHQQHRPADNNIEFWRKFVSEYFAPHAKKRWCVSLYGSGRQTSGVFPQDVWHCEICNRKPGRGFETTVEVLPRLCKIKYDSGTLEELLYVDMPHEYQNALGQIVLDYAKAIQESVFEQLRVVRDGQLRIVFNSDLKICSWEFCARRHEELIPRRLIIPQVSQLGTVAQKYQAATQNATSPSNFSSQDLQNTCNSFVASARQLAKALEVPLVNDLGYTKRYVRCLQISEVVNSMKDLIDYSRETGTGPMASLINFPRAPSASSGLHVQMAQQSEDQQARPQNSNHNDQTSSLNSGVQHPSSSNGIMTLNNTVNPAPSTTSASAIVGLLHQNSMNSRQENPMGNISSPYGGGNAVQIPSASSSSALPQARPNGPTPSSPFPSPTLSVSKNVALAPLNNSHHLNAATSPANISTLQQSTSHSIDADMNDPQSSVQQIIQEMMMSSQANGVGSVGNDIKGINGITPSLNGGNHFIGNGMMNTSGIGNMGYGSMGGIGPAATASGIRAAMMNNPMALTGRGGVNQMGQDTANMNHQQQQNFGNRLLSNGLGRMNSFNNLHFDWKTTQ